MNSKYLKDDTVNSVLAIDRDRSNELLELVGLDPARHADRYPSALSGGERQRVGGARALAADPPVLLMDEPFGAVDPIVRGRLQDQFLRIQAELKKTIVFVTHDIDEAIKMADRIAILNKGGIVEQYASAPGGDGHGGQAPSLAPRGPVRRRLRPGLPPRPARSTDQGDRQEQEERQPRKPRTLQLSQAYARSIGAIRCFAMGPRERGIRTLAPRPQFYFHPWAR